MTSAATLTPEAFDFLSGWLRARSAIEIEPSKAYLVDSRLTPVVKKHGMSTLAELVDALRVAPSAELRRNVVEAMTTHESTFFRDVHPFEALRTTVLPELIERRAARRTLNIWSAACSSGQELYSVAMLLREHFPQLAQWKVTLLGTDLSQAILQKAKEGAFTQIEINRGLPSQFLVKYFRRDGVRWRMADELRQMARFEPLNLMENLPAWMPRMDLVLLRNVLIYFAPANKSAVLQRVRGAMEPDGYLFLGSAETPLNLNAGFERAEVDQSICYRLSGQTPSVCRPAVLAKT